MKVVEKRLYDGDLRWTHVIWLAPEVRVLSKLRMKWTIANPFARHSTFTGYRGGNFSAYLASTITFDGQPMSNSPCLVFPREVWYQLTYSKGMEDTSSNQSRTWGWILQKIYDSPLFPPEQIWYDLTTLLLNKLFFSDMVSVLYTEEGTVMNTDLNPKKISMRVAQHSKNKDSLRLSSKWRAGGQFLSDFIRMRRHRRHI